MATTTVTLPTTAPIKAPSTANMPAYAKNRTSVRFSTYAPSVATVATNDTASNEIGEIASGLDRMENKALSSQRVSLSDEKVDNMHKLALGAKLDRALERRMSGQDAVMRPRPGKNETAAEKKLDEKAAQ